MNRPLVAVCDFCEEAPGKDSYIVEAPSKKVHICESCVHACVMVIEERKGK